jgi:hypothetical protein
MGFSLHSDSGRVYSVDNAAWRKLLKIARRYGWDPMGTEPNMDYLNQRARNPDGGYDTRVLEEMIESWNGSYLTRERQFVTYADALNIAFSLEDAVRDQGLDDKEIRDFISFCKLGRFTIS